MRRFPGCAGRDSSRNDYCIKQASSETAATTASSTTPPSGAPTFAGFLEPTSAPTFGSTVASSNATSDSTTETPSSAQTFQPSEPPTILSDTTALPETFAPTSYAPISAPISAPTSDETMATSTLPLLPLVFIGNIEELTSKLNECEGDCDVNDDCADDLVCFQKGIDEPTVPGCLGEDRSRNDFCIRPEFLDDLSLTPAATASSVPASDSPSTPTVTTTTPTEAPSKTPLVEGDADHSPLPLEIVGNNGDFQVYPIGRCQGDCDIDNDCEPGLVCFQRRFDEPVRGCGTGPPGLYSVDFCIDPQDIQTASASTTLPDPTSTSVPTSVETDIPVVLTMQPRTDMPSAAPSEDPSAAPTDAVTEQPTSSVTEDSVSSEPTDQLPFLQLIVNKDNAKLGECFGDCDLDSDCSEGLICFQRSFREPVPGCQGDGTYGADFCSREPTGSTRP
jgi:hypothetical protein